MIALELLFWVLPQKSWKFETIFERRLFSNNKRMGKMNFFIICNTMEKNGITRILCFGLFIRF